MIRHKSLRLGIRDLSLMATDTIVLDDLDRRWPGTDHLWFRSHGEDRSMIEPVFGFKEVLVGHVVMRHMTIIAIGDFPMRAVRPSQVLGCHQVTVDASLWII